LRDVGGIQQWHNSAPGTCQRTMSSSQHGMEKRFQCLDLSVSHHTYIEASRSAMPCRTTPSRTSPLRPSSRFVAMIPSKIGGWVGTESVEELVVDRLTSQGLAVPEESLP